MGGAALNVDVNEDEQIFENLDTVIDRLESADSDKRKNVPIGILHLSVDKNYASPEAVEFLKWVNENAQTYLRQFGYLTRDSKNNQNEKFAEFASKRGRK